jgi:drug/metabolite transporter (DMT)-like permease
MNWQIPLFISILCLGIASLLQSASIKQDKLSPIAYASFFQLLAGIIVGIFACIRGTSFLGLIETWPNMVLQIVLYTGANILWFKALRHADVSDSIVLLTSKVVWIVLGAALFLKEVLSPIQMIGAVIVVISVVMVSLKGKSLKLGRGQVLALLAAACYGFGFVNDTYMLRSVDVLTYLSIAFFVDALFIWVLYPSITGELRSFLAKENFSNFFFASLFYAIAMVCIFYSYLYGHNTALIATLNQTSAVLTVVLAAILLKERENLATKILGAVIAVCGVYLLNYK